MKQIHLAILVIITSGLIISACKVRQPENLNTPIEYRSDQQKEKFAKNIILLIGDGMGIGQISAGTYRNNNTSNLEKFSVVGMHKPSCYDKLITDSAAAATAFACGEKTYYQAIAVDKDTMPIQTILEEAETKNMATGLVATSTIVHATPASFIAHNKNRRNYEEIALDFLNTDIEYFVGGGNKFFARRTTDTRNLVQELTNKGYVMGNYLNDFGTFKNKIPEKGKVGYLTADDSPLPVLSGRDYLSDASITGLDFLKRQNENGFFIMIEGSQIDWGGHANNAEYIISEFLDFNEVLGNVLEWAEKDGETLVIVTADHETGGFTIEQESRMDSLVTSFTSKNHSGDFIPVFAHGPKASLFTGLYENTEIYHRMRQAYGWK
ncbi:MAG: alkaline phosphatase [Saprospiraceae bacterium]|nr:alkaline phosphatase [Bacteroidia bacterium]NNE15270.1 alkaline phosphatase [Saprospiraceae bacterium]NNL93126.1 alkaline phosphatase [Saprospiraceae bacterium]